MVVRCTASSIRGAGITVVDVTLPIGQAFVPTSDVAAQGATQKLRVGLGELPVVDVGDLHVEHLPTASVPIPSLEAFGDKRPEIVLGYTFFALGAVRVDYTKGEVALAQRADQLIKAGSRAVPMRVLGGKLVADVTIGGQPAAIQLDTGNGGGIDLTKRWASAHGLPGTHKNVTVRGQFGAGAGESDDVFFRLGSAALGPLTFDDSLAQISDEPGESTLAGLAGNQIFARCDAVVFDHAQRTLWLEGACDKPSSQTRFGWRLTRKDDPAFAKSPWVIRSLLPGGAAELSGLHVGDRLLTVGGKPAALDVAPMWQLEAQPAGTKIPLTVSRAQKTERMTLELTVPLR